MVVPIFGRYRTEKVYAMIYYQLFSVTHVTSNNKYAKAKKGQYYNDIKICNIFFKNLAHLIYW